METCLGANPSADAFGKWAKKHHIFLNPDVAFLVPTKTMGMGVFARRALPKGTVIISCPESMSLSPYSKPSAESPAVAVLQAAFEQRGAPKDNTLHVILRLLAELCRCPRGASNSSSATVWRPWLEACPRMDAHLFDLSPAQAAALGLTPGAAGAAAAWPGVAQQLRDLDIAGRWQTARALVVDAHPEVFPPALATFELFCECAAQVYSRNFHRETVPGREGPYLLPGVDIINHAFQCNAAFEVMGGGRKHATTFNVVAARPLVKGEQVYCSYGRIGAARFVVEFQFITEPVVREDMCRFSADVLAAVALDLRRRSRTNTAKGGSSSSRSAEEEQAQQEEEKEEMKRRVTRLQRMGVLYEEGLYINRPFDADDEAKDSLIFKSHHPDVSEEHNTSVRHTLDTYRSAQQRRAECQEQLRALTAVVFLLLASDAEFERLVHEEVNRDWAPPRSAEVRKMAADALWVRREAAAAVEARVDDAFAGETESAATRRRLLHGTLQSEAEILSRYLAQITGSAQR